MTALRKDAHGWWFQIEGPRGPDGKRRRIRRSGFRTRDDAKAALADLQRALDDDNGPASRNLRVVDVSRLKRHDDKPCSPNTATQRKWALDKFDAEFGHRIAADLTAREVQAWVNNLPLAPRSKHHVIKHIRSAWHLAIRRRLLTDDVMADLYLPSVDPTLKVWTPEQVRAWVAAAELELPCVGLATFAADSGLRRGEVLAVRWDDLDLDAGTVTISRQLRVDSATGNADFGPLKRKRRLPQLHLHPATVARLHARAAQQAEHRSLLGDGWTDTGLVFTWPDGTAIRPDYWSGRTQAIANKLGLPAHGPHVLRHSFAAAALHAGVPLEVVSLRMGHASTRVTADLYGHLLPAQDRDVALTIGNLLLPTA